MTREKETNITDRAWDSLCERLTRDGLLATARDARPPTPRARHRMAGLAAALALLALTAWWTARHAGDAARDMRILHNDESGSTLISMLEDGSVVYLAGETSIRYPDRFDRARREISLRGDAFFDISRNPERPFFVDAGPARVEVLGTVFAIRSSDPAAFSLSVRRGEVRVTLKNSGRTVRAQAGHTVQLQAGNLTLAGNADTTALDALLRRIHFKDERLADVVHILNRHTRTVRIEVAREVADMRLTVAFADDDAETMARLICLALNLRHSQREQTIYIAGTDD
ncbi:MAG: FecR domain-containing protein [Tannerella sp.]|jgi:ferric-dicitrate binding protein FerR (iron transport regulator)|nr:FecR domain-containing protein [Tannerella sp.]